MKQAASRVIYLLKARGYIGKQEGTVKQPTSSHWFSHKTE
jgi:hypothetical protein